MDARLTFHRCTPACVCPVHETPLLYAPGTDEHACADVDCVHGHGMDYAGTLRDRLAVLEARQELEGSYLPLHRRLGPPSTLP